jgi:hypothetical protein
LASVSLLRWVNVHLCCIFLLVFGLLLLYIVVN